MPDFEDTVRGKISRAFHAQQHFDRNNDVQLVLPVSDPEPLWATEEEYAEFWRSEAYDQPGHSIHVKWLDSLR